MMNIILMIDGMTCGGCKKSVERLLVGWPGVHTADVDLEAGRAKVTADDSVAPQALAAALTNAGFNAHLDG